MDRIIAVLAFTIVCAIAATAIAVFTPEPVPPLVTKVFEALLGLVTFGGGAVIGLIGGSTETKRSVE